MGGGEIETFDEIKIGINDIREFNKEAADEITQQLRGASRSTGWTKGDFTEHLKSENDVADKFYQDGDAEHARIREVQDAIIQFYCSFI